MPSERTIEDLIRLAAAGDEQAVTDLYEETSSHAYYLALQLVKDEDTADDVLQDSYVKALSGLNTLGDPSKFQSWLNSIVVNTAKDYLKKKKPVLFSQLGSNDDSDEPVDFVDESEQFSPEATVDYNETKRLVKEMIDSLPEEQRIAIILHYMEDYSVKDIAQVMGCSEGTVKSRLNYGRKQIEKDVLDLEKKGVKLYCAPLAPFLFWMFHTPTVSTIISPSATGTASAATVGSTVTAGTAEGAAVGSTVTAGTAGGATVGSSVTTGTAEGAAVGATVTAETATESAVGATVTTGAAASTVGASVTAGTTAAAATGTAAAATGLSLAAKVAIVAAVVCIGGGAAIGTTVAHRNSEREDMDEAIVQMETEPVIFEESIAEPFEDETIEEPQEDIILAADPTDEQRAVILEGIPYLINWFDTFSNGNSILQTSDMTTDLMARYLWWMLFYLNKEPMYDYVQSDYSVGTNYFDWYEKDSAIKHTGDFFGKNFTESDIDSYNATGDYVWFSMDGDLIAPYGAFGGEGNALIVPRIENYTLNGDKLILSIPYNVEWETEPENDSTGHATAVFVTNPDSFFGYSLESLAIGDESYTLMSDAAEGSSQNLSGPSDDVNSVISADVTAEVNPEVLASVIPESTESAEISESTETLESETEEESLPSSTSTTEVFELYLSYENGDASVPIEDEGYLVWEIPGHLGDMSFLLDENFDSYTRGRKPEWEDYAKVRIEGEITSWGNLIVYDLTPITVWDENHNEVPYESISSTQTESEINTAVQTMGYGFTGKRIFLISTMSNRNADIEEEIALKLTEMGVDRTFGGAKSGSEESMIENIEEYGADVVVLVNSSSSAWKTVIQELSEQGIAVFGLNSGYTDGMEVDIEGQQFAQINNSDGRARMEEALFEQIELYFSGATMPHSEITVE